jgi:hypothetical protein
MDLGQSLYRKNYHFEKFSVHQLLINPQVKGYPPVFLICRDYHGSRKCEYIVGIDFNQLNKLLMNGVGNYNRLIIAEKLADFFLSDKKTAEFSLCDLLGKPLLVSGPELHTEVKKFQTEPDLKGTVLYYFQLFDH